MEGDTAVPSHVRPGHDREEDEDIPRDTGETRERERMREYVVEKNTKEIMQKNP